MRTLNATKDCAYWLAECLRMGWSQDQLDALEELWWKFHDERGNLIPGGGREPNPADVRWCSHCGEGVTDFCRGKSEACPMQFKKLRPSVLPPMSGLSGEGEET